MMRPRDANTDIIQAFGYSTSALSRQIEAFRSNAVGIAAGAGRIGKSVVYLKTTVIDIGQMVS